MEDRVAIALGVIALMLLIGGWLVVRKINEKRTFEYRQSGRGKGSTD